MDSFKWMTPWSSQWTCNFWRLSSPSSILAPHVSLACQIWTRSSEHVKGYVTALVESQHYWRMRYINTKNTMRVRSPFPQPLQDESCQILCQAAAKNPEALCKMWLLYMPTCCQYFRCCLPPITKASDCASCRRAMPRYPATESMSCFICVELLVQTCPKFNITTTSDQTEVVRRKHNKSCSCLDVIT